MRDQMPVELLHSHRFKNKVSYRNRSRVSISATKCWPDTPILWPRAW